MTVARGHLRVEGPLRRQQLRGADRRRRAGDRHRVERVPRARLHADAQADAQPGHLRRPQHLQSGEPAGARLHLHLDGAAMSAVLVTGGAGYIGSHAAKALRARGESVVVFDNFSQGHREATGARDGGRRGRHPGHGEARGDDQDPRRRRRDALCRVALGRRFGQGPGRLLPQQRRRDARRCSRRWRRPVSATSCSRRPAPSSARRTRRPSTKTCRSVRSTPTARRSWRSSTRCRISRRAYGLRSVALRYFNAAGADPDGELGEDHAPEIHVIPRALDAAMGRGSFRIFGDDYPTPDGTCLRDYVHVTDLASAHLLALDSLRAGAAVERLQPRERPADLGARRPGRGRARDRQARAARAGAAPRRRSRGPVRLERARQAGPRLAPALRGSRRHRRDRLALARRASSRLRDGDGLMSRLKGQLTDPLLSVVMPAYNEQRHDRGDRPPRAGGAAPHRAHRRRRRLEGRDARDSAAGWRRSCRSRSSCSPPTPARARRCAAVSRK